MITLEDDKTKVFPVEVGDPLFFEGGKQAAHACMSSINWTQWVIKKKEGERKEGREDCSRQVRIQNLYHIL